MRSDGEPLSQDSAEKLSRKARGIAAEMLLSARCAEKDIRVVDPFVRLPVARQADRLHRKLVRVANRGATALDSGWQTTR